MAQKVLHLIDSAGVYGAEKVLLTLLEELQQSPFPGILGCIREEQRLTPKIAEEAQNRGIPVRLFTMRRGISIAGVLQIEDYVRENNIYIVHSHGYKPDILLSLIPSSRFRRVSTIHGWAKSTSGLKVRLYELCHAISLRRPDRIVAVSKAVAADLSRRGVSPEGIAVIYNGIQTISAEVKETKLDLRKRHGLPMNTFVLGAVGRLAFVKGHCHLIRAIPAILSRVPNCQLVIAGEGPLKDRLNRLITELKLEQSVRLIGYQENIQGFLEMIDLFVLPSLTEGLPISLLEAMASGTPVIASAVGGIPEIIADGQRGILVEPENPEALASAVLRLWHDRLKMKELGEAGRKEVRSRFSSQHMAKQYESLYASL